MFEFDSWKIVFGHNLPTPNMARSFFPKDFYYLYALLLSRLFSVDLAAPKCVAQNAHLFVSALFVFVWLHATFFVPYASRWVIMILREKLFLIKCPTFSWDSLNSFIRNFHLNSYVFIKCDITKQQQHLKTKGNHFSLRNIFHSET